MPPPATLTHDARLRLRKGCALVRGARNAALYDLEEKQLYTLDPVAAEALALAGGGARVGQILGRLAAAGHPRSRTEEVLSFIAELPPVLVEESPGADPATGGGEVPVIRPRHRLDFLWLELTGVCNLQCIHCYATAGSAPRPDELTTDEWMRVLEDAAALGCRRVQFTGGDPTIHPDLFPMIERARALGYEFVEIFTNALLLDGEKIERLAGLGVEVAISFYSHDPEVHDRITARPGSWRRTGGAIRALVERGVPVRVAVIVMRPNEDGLEETLRYVRSLGVENVQVDTIRPTGRGDDPALRPARHANEMVAPRFGLGGCCEEGLTFSSCWSGKIAVESRGKVVPCIFSRDQVAGDLRRQSLQEVVTGTRMQFFWDLSLDEVEICRDCEFRFTCHDCRAIAHTGGGGLKKKSPRCTYDPYTGVWGEGSGLQVEDILAGVLGEEGAGPGPTPPGGDGEMTSLPEGAPPGAPRRRPEVLARDVDGEVVLYHPGTQGIHGLNPTASFVWELCDGSRTPEDIAGELEAIYPGQPGVRSDVLQTIESLQSMGLIDG